MDYKNYTIEELDTGLFAINDEKSDSMYLIVGTEKALLIDTCMMEEDILPMLRTITDKPIELALTHAHIDHMYHSNEFQTVYLHEKDIHAWLHGVLKFVYFSGCLMFHLPYKKYNVKHFIPITEESVISLGGNDIHLILATGHTPGSSIFVDTKHQTLFVGDAVGNGGASAWMWVPGCSNISEYRESVIALLNKLKPYESYKFLGGHHQNNLPATEIPVDQTLDIQCVKDMAVLCSKMLDHTIEPVNQQKQAVYTVWQYAYGSTGMWVTKNRIK